MLQREHLESRLELSRQTLGAILTAIGRRASREVAEDLAEVKEWFAGECGRIVTGTCSRLAVDRRPGPADVQAVLDAEGIAVEELEADDGTGEEAEDLGPGNVPRDS